MIALALNLISGIEATDLEASTRIGNSGCSNYYIINKTSSCNKITINSSHINFSFHLNTMDFYNFTSKNFEQNLGQKIVSCTDTSTQIALVNLSSINLTQGSNASLYDANGFVDTLPIKVNSVDGVHLVARLYSTQTYNLKNYINITGFGNWANKDWFYKDVSAGTDTKFPATNISYAGGMFFELGKFDDGNVHIWADYTPPSEAGGGSGGGGEGRPPPPEGKAASELPPFDLTIYPQAFIKELKSSAIYEDVVTVTTNRYIYLTAFFECELDNSCEWADWTNETDERLGVELFENESIDFNLTLEVPELIDTNQRRFYIVIDYVQERVKIPYTLLGNVESTIGPLEPIKQIEGLDAIAIWGTIVVVLLASVVLGHKAVKRRRKKKEAEEEHEY